MREDSPRKCGRTFSKKKKKEKQVSVKVPETINNPSKVYSDPLK